MLTPVENLLGPPALLAWGLAGLNCFRVLKMGLELMAVKWVGGPIAQACEVGPRFCIGVSKFSFVSPLRHIAQGKSFAFLGFLLQWRALCDPPLPTESVVLEALEPFPCPCTLRREPSAHEEPVLQVGEAKSRPVPPRVFLASILMLLSPLSRASECVREGLSSETRRSPGISPGPANCQGDLQSYLVDVSSAS